MNDPIENAFMNGFYMGFMCSGEGYNSEYPYDDDIAQVLLCEKLDKKWKEAWKDFAKGHSYE